MAGCSCIKVAGLASPHPCGYEGIFLALRILFSLLVNSPVAAANHPLINEQDSEISSWLGCMTGSS
jgi:hypothetical protein